MRYLSPTSLPDSPPIDPPDKKALLLQRRKLLAELELSADGILHLKDRPFSRNDILEYFETLQDDTILQYHAALSKDEILLSFLEEGILGEDAQFAEAAIYDDAGFIIWISPYFYTAFTAFVTECLQQTDEIGLRALLHNRLLLTAYDEEQAWFHIGQLLENNIAQLEHFHQQAEQDNTAPPAGDIDPLAADDLIQLILLLPQHPFAGLRDRYAIALMQVAILTFNKNKEKRGTAQKWLENARLLAVSEELAAEISEKVQEVEKIRKKPDAGIVRAAVIMGIIILKFVVFQSPHSSSYDIPKVTRFTYINGKDTVTIKSVHQLDSMMHHRSDSIKLH